MEIGSEVESGKRSKGRVDVSNVISFEHCPTLTDWPCQRFFMSKDAGWCPLLHLVWSKKYIFVNVLAIIFQNMDYVGCGDLIFVPYSEVLASFWRNDNGNRLNVRYVCGPFQNDESNLTDRLNELVNPDSWVSTRVSIYVSSTRCKSG